MWRVLQRRAPTTRHGGEVLERFGLTKSGLRNAAVSAEQGCRILEGFLIPIRMPT